ncbi:helicase, partial [Phormidium pseudopriestleyi FRX01]|nr:helicase [Phormidium pseudopriestleyi FRX01]
MKLIKLPPVLSENLDLAAINQQLREGRAKLDWSSVQSAPDSVLKVLLEGIDSDSEVLNLDEGVSDRIIKVVSNFSKSRRENISGEIPSETSLPVSIFTKPSPAQIRAELEELIIQDLLGPVNGETEEIDETRVTDRYLVGVLAPLFRNKGKEEAAEEQQDELAVGGQDNSEEGTTEKTVAIPSTMFPSSMGLTFCVENTAESLEITASWGKYEREKSEILVKENGEPQTVWKRDAIAGSRIQPLKQNHRFEWVPSPEQAGEIIVKGQSRRMDNGDWIVTVFLVNGQHEPAKLRDRAWVFQPELKIRSGDKNHPPIFIKRPLPLALENLDPMIRAENEAMGMLYRRQVEFAVGHGVSVAVQPSKSIPKSAE